MVRRHRLSTRLWHWLNAGTVLVLLMSGLMIFNAHPRLYWGEYGANADRAWLEIGSTRQGEGQLQAGGWRLRTTGVLGVWRDSDGEIRREAFPGWATIPSDYSLSDARLWHLAFAWVLAAGLFGYLAWSLINGHIARDLHVRAADWSPAHIWRDVKDHARCRFPAGEAALRYGVLQKLAYCAVLFGLLPVMIATGLAMSPGMDAAWPWLTQMFGGRQSARSFHFITAFGLLGFSVVHVVMVVLSGPFNHLRAMLTGRYRLPSATGAP